MEKGVIGIIFISLFILFGSIAFITGFIPPGATCFDEDFGNYGVQGTCQDIITSHEDVCTNSNTLREYDCTAADYCGFELKTCDSGCVGGACVASTGCTDTDGGINYSMRGNCINSIGTYEERCITDDILREYYCGEYEESNQCFGRDYTCPNGCSNGACRTSSGTDCTDHVDCPPGELCVSDSCAVVNTNTDCPTGDCVLITTEREPVQSVFATGNLGCASIGKSCDYLQLSGHHMRSNPASWSSSSSTCSSSSLGSNFVYRAVCITSSGGSCTDTDVTDAHPDGKNYNLRGTTTGSDGVPRTDVCTGGDMLLEYYCDANGDAAYPEDDWECLLGCLNEACMCEDDNDCDLGYSCSATGNCVASTSTGADCELVSDTDTLIDGNPSIHSDTVSGWTAVIPGATWIWNESTVSNPEVNSTVIFTKTFDLSSTGMILGGTLVVAADNSYSCELNGEEVGANENEMNFRAGDEGRYSLSGPLLKVGLNTLVCKVKNWEMPGAESGDNPAGLLYRLSVTGGACVASTGCTDTDGGINYLSPGTASEGTTIPGSFSMQMDSCNTDGTILKEYYCADGAVTFIEYPCDCVDSYDGGYCELSGAGMVCEAFNSHPTGGSLISRTEMDGFVDEEIKDLLELDPSEWGYIGALTLSEVPVKSKVENPGGIDDIYYCGLDLLWHRVKPTVADISCINELNIECLSNDACLGDFECYLEYSCEGLTDKDGNPILDDDSDPITFCDYDTTCLEDNECESNSCVDNYCISISAELVAQRSILTRIWCAVTNLISFVQDGGVESEDYLQCMYESFGGVN